MSDLMVGGKLLSSLRVVDLKEELEKRGYAKSGTKKDLADRLKTVQISIKRTKANKVTEAPPAPIAADDEQLPNISMQETLAEQNPFIRDYFASQAELFHSQKVAKKLLEEEARRESEASQDESEECSASEDKDLNSSTEEKEGGKVRRLAKRFENNSTKETKVVEELPKRKSQRKLNVISPIITDEIVVEKSPIKSTREKQLEKLAKKVELSNIVQKSPSHQPVQKSPSPQRIQQIPNKSPQKVQLPPSPEKPTITENKMPVEVIKDKPDGEEDEKSVSNASSPPSRSRSSSRSRSNSPIINVAHANIEDLDSNHKEVHDSSSSSEEEEDQEDEREEINNGTVKRLTEHFENQSQEKPPVKILEPEVVSNRDESRSPSRSRTPSPIPLPEERRRSGRITRSSVDESPKKEVDIKKFPPKSIASTIDKDTESKNLIVKEDEDVKHSIPKKLTITAPEHIKQPPTQIRSPRIPSVRKESIEDEEILDYGEEEKIFSPAKFTWDRRIIRIKSKHVPKVRNNSWARKDDSKHNENINSESMLQWFSEVKLIPASDLRLEEKEKSPRVSHIERGDLTEYSRKFSIDSEESQEIGSIKVENITITRKVCLVPLVPAQQTLDEDKDLSPPRNPASELILVTNLVRPFTLPQLRELLQRTGNLQELWVDKIKSKCIAKYEKEEEAFETRAALHGINWPQSNPKALHVDYTTQEKLDDYKAKEAGIIKPLVAEQPVVAENLPVREWDVGKRAKSRSPKRRRSRSTSRDRKRSRRTPSPNRRRHSRSPHHDRRSRGDAKEQEPLGKALDELFRKTIATPSIYWLPLTPQQIAEKEELRRKRMLERERRLAEINRTRPR